MKRRRRHKPNPPTMDWGPRARNGATIIEEGVTFRVCPPIKRQKVLYGFFLKGLKA